MKLILKYNTSAPRYTSYPTVPLWDRNPTTEEWKKLIKKSFKESNHNKGISLYIHLPYCESLCTYCGCNTRITVNHKVEIPYIESVIKEWKMYLEVFGAKPKIKEIHLGGGTPTFFSPENLIILIKNILAASEIADDAEFSFEAHPGNTTVQHLKALYHVGFRRVSFGIQDFDPKVQEIINRKQTFEEVQQIVELAREVGYTSINFDLIYGLPLQTPKSVVGTINKVRQLKPDRIAFYSYAHVPWIKPGQRKFTEFDLPVDAEKRALYELGRKQLKDAKFVEIGMDHFALKTDSLYKASINETLHRNFMGYTHNHTQLMIGLGVSSISDTWYAFAQNVKTVEEYRKIIDEGQLPIFRGHVLSKEDLIVRKHILNIMCKFETSWINSEEQCKVIYDAIPRLAEFENDKLIELHPFNLTVTTKGRAFLRNICMAFDARLWRTNPQQQMFSSSV